VQGSSAKNEGGGFCCQVPPNPACRSLSRQDFKYRYYKPLTRPALPEHSCRWQLWIGPLRRSHLGQKHVLYALVDPVSAPSATQQSLQVPWSSLGFRPNELMVEPPGTAPGSDRFITTPVYRHSRPLRDGRVNIGGEGLRRKGALLNLSPLAGRGRRVLTRWVRGWFPHARSLGRRSGRLTTPLAGGGAVHCCHRNSESIFSLLGSSGARQPRAFWSSSRRASCYQAQ